SGPDDARWAGAVARRRSAPRALASRGTLSLRAPVGDGPRGLQSRRQGLAVLPSRPRALTGLSLGRGWAGRHLGQPPASLFRARVVERARPHPQGAPLRTDRPGGQPRRGRQGVLLLPRLHADALLHEVSLQVPAGGLS